MSLIEAITNVAVGFGVALLTQILVFPLFRLQVSLGENLAIGVLFTLASIAGRTPCAGPSRRSEHMAQERIPPGTWIPAASPVLKRWEVHRSASSSSGHSAMR